MCFIKSKGRLDKCFGLYRHYLTFSLHSQDFFHHSSFYLKNFVLSVQLLFMKSYVHSSPRGNVRGGGKCPRPQSFASPLNWEPIKRVTDRKSDINTISIEVKGRLWLE